MTFRAKPVAKRSQRPSWECRDRRYLYLNLGFGVVVVAAVTILLIAVGFTYYNDNLASVATVGDQSISRSQWRDRAVIEQWRLQEAQNRIRTQTVAGRLTQAQAEVQLQIIAQQLEQAGPLALERMIDNLLQADLATQEGVTVTDADVDAQLTKEATTPESRHAWLIEVAPEVDEGAIEPTTAQVAAARAAAEDALRDLQNGTSWDQVAKTVSTDTATAPQAGDLGWLNADDTGVDPQYLEAIFAATVDEPTAIIESEDGIFRIGRVSEIAPESVDEAYQAKLANDGIDLVKYREVVRGDVVRQKLEDSVVADALQPGPQRQVSEIFIEASDPETPPTAVKVRHILYSPKDDPGAASGGDIPETDPSWTEAKADADDAYTRLQADPTLFDAIARAESDETSALGVTGTGGKLPGFITADSGLVEAFSDAVLAPGLTDGQILAPFQTEFGWHIAQIMYHPTEIERLDALKAQADGGASFATLARDNSESETAGRGGDLGWVAPGQLQEALIEAIQATPVGSTSEVVTIPEEGSYLFEVRAEAERAPDPRQEAQIRSSAFSEWYQAKKEAVEITRDPTISGFVG
jgi:parvulin-like peptidyl-prolyl isomerase